MVSAILELSLRPEDKIDLILGYRVKGCVRATGTGPPHCERSPTRPSARRSHRTDNAPARRATAPVLTPGSARGPATLFKSAACRAAYIPSSMSMPPERRAAIALLIGVLAPLLIMGMHPTGGDITRGGARLVAINHLVHGVSLAAQPVVFLGLLGLWRSVRSDLATAALVFYGFGIVAILSAAVLSGFVAPDVVADRLLLGYTGMLNQAFAKVSVAAIGASLTLWGAALWPIGGRGGVGRLPAPAGVVVGAVLAL